MSSKLNGGKQNNCKYNTILCILLYLCGIYFNITTFIFEIYKSNKLIERKTVKTYCWVNKNGTIQNDFANLFAKFYRIEFYWSEI